MKFVLFVEGDLEDKILREFWGRWLRPRLETNVGIKIYKFDGWADMVRSIEEKVRFYLDVPKSGSDVIAVIALLDLYGPIFYPASKRTARERYEWAKNYLEGKVNHPKFRQHFAVHETEAWLLSDPSIFPPAIKKALEGKYPTPETVNSDKPPASLLEHIYLSKTGKGYRKILDGEKLFAKLDPEVAYAKCPSLKALLDEMLRLAQGA